VGVKLELSLSGSIVVGGLAVLEAAAQEDLGLKNLGCT
jgi:hypothetical protein